MSYPVDKAGATRNGLTWKFFGPDSADQYWYFLNDKDGQSLDHGHGDVYEQQWQDLQLAIMRHSDYLVEQ